MFKKHFKFDDENFEEKRQEKKPLEIDEIFRSVYGRSVEEIPLLKGVQYDECKRKLESPLKQINDCVLNILLEASLGNEKAGYDFYGGEKLKKLFNKYLDNDSLLAVVVYDDKNVAQKFFVVNGMGHVSQHGYFVERQEQFFQPGQPG